jgi:hypothetical protein
MRLHLMHDSCVFLHDLAVMDVMVKGVPGMAPALFLVGVCAGAGG